jgi:hypothetical protein
MEQLLEQLSQIQQFTLLYPPLGEKGPRRLATVLSKQSLAQQALADSLGLEQLCSTQRGSYFFLSLTPTNITIYRCLCRLTSKLPLADQLGHTVDVSSNVYAQSPVAGRLVIVNEL